MPETALRYPLCRQTVTLYHLEEQAEKVSRTVLQGEYVLVHALPRRVAQAGRAVHPGVEHLAVLQAGAGAEAGAAVFLGEVFLNLALQYRDLDFFHCVASLSLSLQRYA